MPLVRIDMWAGQGPEVKQALVRNVTKAVVDAVGCPVEAVEILICEQDKANWAQGGVTHAERFPSR
ncbi:MAG: tautomerase family protein [Thermoanaerobaculaceae bacterium]|nr:tautomerase family protein [Thermoanaerobaculaceae bacterium]MDI9620694.1 2-hydroxymuconate tautomerase [Acidobacteriota bacterium]NLH10664.1 4-oxalocrotonate tautomerase [Holophagae bacterium]